MEDLKWKAKTARQISSIHLEYYYEDKRGGAGTDYNYNRVDRIFLVPIKTLVISQNGPEPSSHDLLVDRH